MNEPRDSRTVGIVLGAGRSRRMGRPKLLLPWESGTIIGSLIDAFEAGGVESITVVVAEEEDALSHWIRNRGLGLTVNPDPSRGMLSSLWQALDFLGGASHLRKEGVALLISPADYPLVRRSTVKALLAKGTVDQLRIPTYLGRRGHPLWIPPSALPEIPQLPLNQGLKALRNRVKYTEVPVDDPGILQDIDTPQDYEDNFR